MHSVWKIFCFCKENVKIHFKLFSERKTSVENEKGEWYSKISEERALIRILIVEDDEHIAKMIAAALNIGGYQSFYLRRRGGSDTENSERILRLDSVGCDVARNGRLYHHGKKYRTEIFRLFPNRYAGSCG